MKSWNHPDPKARWGSHSLDIDQAAGLVFLVIVIAIVLSVAWLVS